MADALIRLATKPTLADEIRAEVIRLLEEALAEAKEGKIDSLVMILKRPDGYWMERISGVQGMADAVGRLEIIKQSWIDTYLKECKR